MIRFYAGRVALHRALEGFDFFMRLDTDSFLLDAWPDVFEDALIASTKYRSWPITTMESWRVSEGFSEFVAAFAERHAEWGLPRGGWDERFFRVGADDKPEWTNRMYYNNFEVVSLSWMRSTEYMTLFQEIDDLHFMFTRRWSDAIIRTAAVHLLLDKSDILDDFHSFVPYFHQLYCTGRSPCTRSLPDALRSDHPEWFQDQTCFNVGYYKCYPQPG